MSDNDPFNLERFVQAQRPVYETVLAELRSGAKRSHWMWYIFPQIAGLGQSSTSRYYAIRKSDEAAAYLAHPVLGPRLVECSEILMSLHDLSASDIFGSPDDVKLRSSMTLFASVPSSNPVFSRVLDRYFAGQPDTRTLLFLGKSDR